MVQNTGIKPGFCNSKDIKFSANTIAWKSWKSMEVLEKHRSLGNSMEVMEKHGSLGNSMDVLEVLFLF